MEIAGTLQSAETAWLDLRLSHLRQRDRAAEKVLLESIRTEGIKQPLVVVMPQTQKCLLLDGFKRYRCAKRLSMGVVPILTVEGDEKEGLLALMRFSREKSLTEIEHGAIVDRLHNCHGMSVMQIAQHLGCSTGWVSMRLGMISQMSALIRRKVLSGEFPPRAYLYGVRPFTRVNDTSQNADRFVMAVSGRGLSTRELFLLSRAYFQGSRVLRSRIEQGEVEHVLEALRNQQVPDGGSGVQTMLDQIQSIVAGMDRLTASLAYLPLHGDIAPLQAHLACANLLRRIRPFTRSIREFYGRSTEAIGGIGTVGAGQEQKANCPLAATGCEDRARDYRSTRTTAQADFPLSCTAAD
jgi:hypothetical protein